MALFDEDNPGKNLTNVTIWLESSEDSGGPDGSGCSGCGLKTAIYILAGVVLVCSFLISCVVTAMYG